MKDHYVSFKCAQMLKRLGFKEEVSHYYCHFKSDGEVKIWSTNPPDNHNARLSTNEVCSAPRLDQAQAWLRDCKGIHVSPNPYYICHRDEYGNIYEERYLWSFELMRVPSGDYRTIGDGGDYESYEEALSAGISKALELLGKEVSNGM